MPMVCRRTGETVAVVLAVERPAARPEADAPDEDEMPVGAAELEDEPEAELEELEAELEAELAMGWPLAMLKENSKPPAKSEAIPSDKATRREEFMGVGTIKFDFRYTDFLPLLLRRA